MNFLSGKIVHTWVGEIARKQLLKRYPLTQKEGIGRIDHDTLMPQFLWSKIPTASYYHFPNNRSRAA